MSMFFCNFNLLLQNLWQDEKSLKCLPPKQKWKINPFSKTIKHEQQQMFFSCNSFQESAWFYIRQISHNFGSNLGHAGQVYGNIAMMRKVSNETLTKCFTIGRTSQNQNQEIWVKTRGSSHRPGSHWFSLVLAGHRPGE